MAKTINDVLVDRCMARWDSCGLACGPGEVLQILHIIAGNRKLHCLHVCIIVLISIMHNYCLSCLDFCLMFLLAGSWEHPTMSVGDVVKLYITCDVMGVDRRETIYNVASTIVVGLNK